MRLLLLIALGVACACGGGEDGRGGGIAIHTRADEAPAWAVPYGAEFWHPQHGVDVQDAISRVSHAFRGSEVRSAGYAARIDGTGLRLQPAGGAELTLRTARVMVGGHELYRAGGEVPWSIVGDTAQALLASGVVEHYQARDEGVEVSWVIAQRGEIVIEATFDGLAIDGSSRDIHFVDGKGARVAKLGSATLIDQAGHRWPVAPELDGGVVRYHVGAEIAASAAFPVALDPVVGPELTPDRPVIGSAFGVQAAPGVANNGTSSLVVWEDARSGTLDIYGARVSSGGTVLDPAGIPLVIDASGQRRPRVASNGSDFLVVWDDYRRGGAYSDVYAARVSGSGVVRDPGGFWLAAPLATEGDPSVASNGVDYLVAWQTSTNIMASRISATGLVLDAGGVALSSAGGSVRPSVASNGLDYLAVWTQGGDLHGTRVSASGIVLDPQSIVVSTQPNNETFVAVTSNHSDYLVAWHEWTDREVYAARVTASGIVLDPNGIDLGPGMNASIASDGGDYLVAWAYDSPSVFSAIGARRVTAAGTTPDPTPIVVSGRNDALLTAPVATFDGARYLVAWSYDGDGIDRDDIQASRVAVDGTVLDAIPVIVSTAPVSQSAPVVAANAHVILVAWVDGRAGKSDLYAARISPAGTPLDPDGLVVNANGVEELPAVASNGADFLVTFADRSVTPGQVTAVRVTSAGVVGTPVALGDGTLDSAVASDGTDYVVTWWGTADDIAGARVLASGARAGASFTIADAPSQSYGPPALAWGGGHYLAAWPEPTPGTGALVATRLSATGQVLDQPSIVVTSSGTARRPSLAASGSEYLVVWDDVRDSMNGDIHGARIGFDGTVLDPATLPIATGPNVESLPAVSSNGTEYMVTWLRASATYDIVGTRVTTSGSVEDPGGFMISASSPIGTATGLAYSPASSAYVIAYQAQAQGDVHDRFIAVAGCGDGVLGIAEACDDGGTADGDGCSAQCAIEAGYTCTGAPSICSDIDECAANNGDCAQTCTNTAGGFSCSCAPGYALDIDGRICRDLDECATNNGGCAQTCTNTLASFQCSCSAGYVLASDGLGCDDIDECATSNGGCAHICTNTLGSFECSCLPGYELDGDGHSCEDVDECATNNGDCTHVCTNLPGSRACSCHEGYMLDTDGTTCIDVNECVAGTSECDPFAFCINTTGSYECTCDEGYVGDGHTCKKVNAETGCGCRSTDARGSWLLVVACLGALRRRRRSALAWPRGNDAAAPRR